MNNSMHAWHFSTAKIDEKKRASLTPDLCDFYTLNLRWGGLYTSNKYVQSSLRRGGIRGVRKPSPISMIPMGALLVKAGTQKKETTAKKQIRNTF